MGLFGASSLFDADVEKATSEKNTSEQWGLILDVCDKAGKTAEDAKNCLRSIIKRLNSADPHIALQAATLLDACVNNAGKVFHVEIASREFETEYVKLLKKSHPKVVQKLKESLKKWSEGDFKSDQQLNLIPSLYSKLKNSGVDFAVATPPVKKTAPLSKDPNVVESQEEEDQIAKAIELSLKDTSGSPKLPASSSLYPSANLGASAFTSMSSAAAQKEHRVVRALYDFEAAEDNELTFLSGEIIHVLDDSDQNWWKGSNQRGEGLFPANFVTADLSVEPEQFLYEKAKKAVQFNESVEVKPVVNEPEEVEINEEKIDRLLHLLHEADPTNPEQDTEEMLNLECEVNSMGPLIDTELERVDCKHAQLTQLSSDLVEALGLYHSLMREPQYTLPHTKMPYSYSQATQPSSMAYNGTFTPGPVPYINPSHPGHERPFLGHPGPSQNISIPSQYQMPPSGMPPPSGHMSLPQGPEPLMRGSHSHTIPPGLLPPGASITRFPPGVTNFGAASMTGGFPPALPPSNQLPHHNSSQGTPSQNGSFPPHPALS